MNYSEIVLVGFVGGLGSQAAGVVFSKAKKLIK